MKVVRSKVVHGDFQGGYRLRFSTIHGYRRAYVLLGSGPAVLLLHGIGDSSDTWRRVIPELAQTHTVIAPDLLGHGRSDRPRADYSIAAYACGMRDLLSVLDVERATVVGHSLGGGVAMQFAYQFPERCERLVLVSSGGVGRQTTPLLQMLATPGFESLLPILTAPGIRHMGTATIKLLKLVGTDLGRDADDLIRLFDALPDRMARNAFLRTLRAAVDRHGQVITMLDRCYLTEGMPTLLIWGGRDAVIPADHGRIVHAAMPGSKLEIFDDAGHFPHHSEPERFLSLVRDFLTSTEPASYSVAEWRALLRAGRTARPGAALGAEATEALADAVPSGA
jgi:pimeloyl-ACP methyl ester carboxylesterase